MTMAFDQRDFATAQTLADATRDMWRRRNRAAMETVDHWFEALRLPGTGRSYRDMQGRWHALSNWPGDKLVYLNEEDEAAAIVEGREPSHRIPPDHASDVIVECGEVRCRVMEQEAIKALDLIAYAKGLLDQGKPDWPRAWEWLRHRIDFSDWNTSLELIIPKKPKFTPASDLAELPVPPREWLLEGLIPDKTVTLLAGDGGTGKSLFALQLSAAVASRGEFLGMEPDGGAVIFLSAEDDMDELHRRLADVAAAMGLGLESFYDLHIRSMVGSGALLAESGRVGFKATDLFNEIERAVSDLHARLVVLDTLANFFPGDENDRAQTTQFVDIIKGLAVRCGCAVLLLAHPSKSSMETGAGYSGNTAWNNAVRSRLYLQRVTQDGYEPDPDARGLRTMKANYGRVGGEIAMTWQAGVFVPVAPATGLDRAAGSAKAERVFLALLADFAAQGRYVSSSPSNAYAPAVFAAHPKAEGMTKRALTVAMNTLFDRGVIVIEEHGKGAKARKHIAVAGGQGAQHGPD